VGADKSSEGKAKAVPSSLSERCDEEIRKTTDEKGEEEDDADEYTFELSWWYLNSVFLTCLALFFFLIDRTLNLFAVSTTSTPNNANHFSGALGLVVVAGVK